ncbi:uncharacterized protein BDFB_004438, partial [Asbolus verrucosus]
MAKGQYAQLLPRDCRSYYIRTIGYIDDEKSYHQFLIEMIRAATDYFSYNDRYEVGEFKKIGNKEILVVKGQYAQLFDKKNGGYYVRTIGYIDDENGYHSFLLDLSKAVTEEEEIEKPFIISGGPVLTTTAGPGGPGFKPSISSTVLISLSGGNA